MKLLRIFIQILDLKDIRNTQLTSTFLVWVIYLNTICFYELALASIILVGISSTCDLKIKILS